MAAFFHFVQVRAVKISFRAEINAQIILCDNIYLNRYLLGRCPYMLVDRLLLYCISHNVVAEDDIPMLRYCIEKKLNTIVTLIPLVAVGIPIAGVLTTVSFLWTFIYLRQMTNGYHAKTPRRCFLSSILLELLILACARYNFPFGTILTMTAASALVIWLFSPYPHPNMNYSPTEILVCRVISRKRVLIVFFVMFLCYALSMPHIVNGICFGTILASVLLGFAYTTRQRS